MLRVVLCVVELAVVVDSPRVAVEAGVAVVVAVLLGSLSHL